MPEPQPPIHKAPAPPGGPAPEGEARFSRSILSLFLTPLVIVGPLVVLAAAFLLLFVARERTPRENLARVLDGGANERWQAAMELTRQLQDPETAAAADAAFFEQLLAAYGRSREEDPRVREFLGLSLGFLGNARAVPALLETLRDPGKDEAGTIRLAAIRAVGSIADAAAAPALAAILREDPDVGLRVQAANALGSLPGEEAAAALLAALADGQVLVRWNAAVALAGRDRAEGIPHLLEMLERRNLASFAGPNPEERREVALVSAIRALERLRAEAALPRIEELGRSDPNPRVQDAALRAARALRSD